MTTRAKMEIPEYILKDNRFNFSTWQSDVALMSFKLEQQYNTHNDWRYELCQNLVLISIFKPNP